MQTLELLRNAVRRLVGRSAGEDYRQPRHTVVQAKARGHEADILALPLDSSNAFPMQSLPVTGSATQSITDSFSVVMTPGATVNHSSSLAIPAGVWDSATWHTEGVFGVSPLIGQKVGTSLGDLISTGVGTVQNYSSAEIAASPAHLTAINAAAGGNLTVILQDREEDGSPCTDNVSLLRLTVTGTPTPVPSQFYFMPDYDVPGDPNVLIL